MNNKIIWKDIDSSTIKGLLICELPPITKPKMRVQETAIDGVDGSIIEELGYETYDKSIRIGLTRDFDIDEVIKYFTGEGNVVFSNEPNKYYKARIIEQIDYERLLRFKEAVVKFRVQPFKYEYQEEEQKTETGKAEGTEIKITDAKATEMQIDGRSTQATRSGKNLLKPYKETHTSRGVTFTATNKGFLVNGTIDEGSANSTATLFYGTLTAGTYTINGISGSSNTKFQLLLYINKTLVKYVLTDNYTFTLDADSLVDMTLYIYPSYGTFNNLLLPYQLEEGSTATEYEAYGVSPSPDYPSEIESLGYENLFDGILVAGRLNEDGSVTGTSSELNKHSNLIEILPNTYYTYSCTIPREGVSNRCVWYDENSNVIGSFNVTDTDNKTELSPSNAKYISIGIYNVEGQEIMFKKGTKVHSYIPYGKSGIEVETIGENLFNIDTITKNTYISSNGTMNSSSVSNVSDFIKVKAGETYVFIYEYSVLANTTVRSYCLYNSNKKLIGEGHNYVPSDKGFKTTPTQDGYIRIGYDINVTDIQFIIEKNMKKTSVIELNAPLRSLPNGVKDIAYIKNNKLYVDRYVGSIVFDGNETGWIQATVNGIIYFYINIFNSIATSKNTNIISNHFVPNKENVINGFYLNNSNLVVFNNGIATTLEEFKTWLSTHNTQVDYELATPVTEEYGDLTILELVDGENNISNSADTNMVIDYVGTLKVNNTGNYISKPIFEIEGAGNIKFILNGNSVFTYNFDDDGKVVIDSEKEDAYLGAVLKNRKMNGEFPKLELGENIITWDGIVKNIKVTKKSRWL